VPKGVSPDTKFSKETVSADTAYTHDRPSANTVYSQEQENKRFGGVSGNTAFAQQQENARFNAMPVETGAGFVTRAQAIGQPGKKPEGVTDLQNFSAAQRAYDSLYGSAQFGLKIGAPKFDQWLQTDWPVIAKAGGLPVNRPGPGPAPAAPMPGRAAGGPITGQGIPPAPQNPADRQPGTVYQTPKGPLRWMGNGWAAS
jgi:hypothetical protein